MIRSSILEKHGSTETGLYLLKLLLSPDLYTGVTFAIFKLSGNIQFSNDKSNICFSGVHNSPKHLLTTL